MNTLVIKTLVGEIFNRFRLSYIVVFIILPVSVKLLLLVLNSTVENGLDPLFIKMTRIALVMGCIFIVFAFAYLETNNKSQKSEFPAHLFRLPLTSFQLAIVPLVSGILCLFFYVSLWLLFVEGQFLNTRQYSIIFFCAAISISWIQTISWRFGKQIVMSIIIFTLVISSTVFLTLISLQYPQKSELINPDLTFSLLILLAFLGIEREINSIKKLRYQHDFFQLKFKLPESFPGFQLPGSYQSKTQAYFRFEWRVFGWLLPLFSLMLIGILLMMVFRSLQDIQIFDLSMLVLFALIYLPVLMQMDVMKPKSASRSREVDPFINMKPLSDFQIAMGKLKMSFFSMLTYQTLVLMALNLVFINHLPVIEMQRQLSIGFEQFRTLSNAQIIMFILMLNLLVPFLVWAMAGNIASWSLKGKNMTFARMIKFTLTLIFLFFAIYQIIHNEFWLSLITENQFIILTAIASGIMGIVVVKFQRFRKRYSLKNIKSVMLVLLVGSGYFLISIWNLPLQNNIRFQLSIWILIFTLLNFLPSLTSGFSVSLNRHR